jgi:4-amino-4-deoxy-L-arabinose transferase-like glycosyltransferase
MGKGRRKRGKHAAVPQARKVQAKKARVRPAAAADPARRKEILILAAIFLVAVLVRLVFFLDYQKLPFAKTPIVDAEFHDRWAMQILAGDIFSVKQGELLYKAPLYPYFMAFVYLVFGHSTVAVQLVQVVLGGLSCCLIYLIARSYFPRAAGILAAAFYGLYFVAVATDVTMEIPALAVFLTLLSFYLLVRTDRRPRPLLSGLFLALSILALPTNLLLVPLYAVVVFKKAGRRTGLAFVAVVAAVMAPVTLRNIVIGRSLTLVSANSGINLYLGNCRDADRATAIYPGLEWQVLTSEPVLKENLRTNAGQARYWTRRTMAEVFADVPAAAGRVFRKVVRFFMNYEIMRNDDPDALWKSSVLSRFPFPVAAVIFPFAFVGLFLLVRTRIAAPPGLAWAIGLLAAPSVIYFVTSRYRLPTMPFFALPAGFAGASLIGWARAKRWKSLGTALVALAVLSAAVRSNIFIRPNDPARRFYDLATCYYAQRNAENVLTNAARCLDLLDENPDKVYPRAEMLWTLGNVYVVTGDYDLALANLDRALALFPEYGNALVDKGAAHLSRTEFDRAFDALLRGLDGGFFADERIKERGYYLFEETIRTGRPVSRMRDALAAARDETVRKILAAYL